MSQNLLEFGLTQNAIGDNIVLARKDGEVVGMMQLQPPRKWAGDTSLVLMIQVAEEHRRQGIATGMWKFAKAEGLNPMHELQKTEDGDAWAKAVGD